MEPEIKQYPKVYKADSKGKTRVWWAESLNGQIRNVSGLLDGEKVESGWKQMKPKNVGKANETTAEAQAEIEIAALYEKKTFQGGYHYEAAEGEEAVDITAKKYIEPMLAQKYADVVIDFDRLVYSQPKLDGHRCIATKDGLFTRKGKRFYAVPHIEFALLDFFLLFPDAILDGELYNHDLRDNFNELSSYVRKTKPTPEDLKQSEVMQYHVYDVIDSDVGFRQRSARLYQYVTQSIRSPKIQFVPTDMVVSQEDLDAKYGEYLDAGYEGQMVRYSEPYQIGKRSANLIKRKEFFDEEFRIVDIEEGEGNWAGCAKAVVIESIPTDGSEPIQSRSGIRGSKEFAVDLLARKAEYVGHGTATVRFPNKTPDGKPRFAVAVALFPGERDV